MENSQPEQPSISDDEYLLLVEEVQDYAIFLLSPTGEIRSWNRGATRIMGYAAEEALGKSFSIFYTPEDLENEKPRHELEIAAAEGRVEDEGWRLRGDGGRFWANTVITALRERGVLRGFAKVTRDMTQRRAAEERTRQSEEQFRLLVQSVRDYAIFMLDPDGYVATWNTGAKRIKGYEASEIIGRHFSTFYPEEDVKSRKPERELEIAREHGSVEDEGWRIRKDGSRFWANVVITAVRDQNGVLRGFTKVTRDITERKEADELRQSLLEQREARLLAEEDRRRAEASYTAAQEANRAKDEFLMTLSHELRTPMTAILGWARLLPTIEHDDPLFPEAVASIRRSAQLQASLIDDVLDVSRIVSGKLRLNRETLVLQRVIEGATEAVRPMAEARSITMTTSVSPQLGSIVADATRLHQVIWNLLTNALKFTPKGGTVEVSARRTGSQVQICVTDSGEGIEPHFLAHVFEPFRQAENPRTRVHGGLGLGLSIVRYLVEAHGGTVTAESRGRGQGASFTVTLPVAALSSTAGSSANRNGEALKPIDPHELENVRMLLVDDDRETREFVRAVLRKAGADVIAVESARVALEKIADLRPDVIVTDIAMPSMDGYEFVRTLRNMEAGVRPKVIALTAFAPGTDASERSGFDAYLVKPIDPHELVRAIARVAGKG